MRPQLRARSAVGGPPLAHAKMVPLSRASSNHLDDPEALFRTLDEWNEVLRGRLADSTRDAHSALPQSKKRRAAPRVRRRHKKMGGAA